MCNPTDVEEPAKGKTEAETETDTNSGLYARTASILRPTPPSAPTPVDGGNEGARTIANARAMLRPTSMLIEQSESTTEPSRSVLGSPPQTRAVITIDHADAQTDVDQIPSSGT